ncbi:MAG TPA: glyoxalase-like domain protein, partial [Allocoleopsis sp.]
MFLASLPLDSLFSTQGIMVMLLGAYAAAMWMFLSSAPKVHTIMVSDLEIARQFYEGLLDLPIAEIPLHYYYNYEQTLGASTIDPLYLSPSMSGTVTKTFNAKDGLWYQLK